MLYGYAGRLLRIDLSTREVHTEALDENVLKQYIGGTGLGIKYLYDEVPADADWDDERNRVIISSGPLGGTPLAGSGTVSLVTKGAMTHGATASQANGYFGAYMKQCGFDSIILQGVSSDWVYIYIHNGSAEIRDASNYIGLDTWECAEAIRKDLGKKKREISVAAIGPAGENMVRFSCLVFDGDHVASKNGNGAVLGSKRVKAIVTERNVKNPAPVYDMDALKEVAADFREDIDFTQFGNGTSTVFDGGTLAQQGNCLMYNCRQVYDENPDLVPKLQGFGSIHMRAQHDGKRDACFACNATHCHELVLSEGDHKGEIVNEPEYECGLAFGPVIGNFNGPNGIWLATLADKLGIDGNECGWLLGLVMECVENGILTADDLDGLDMTWGNTAACEELLKKISLRKGVGDFLAEGTKIVAERLGPEAMKMAVYIEKGTAPRGVPFKASFPLLMDYALGNGGTNDGMAELADPDFFGIDCSIGSAYRGMSGDLDQAIEFNSHFGWGNLLNDCFGICYFPTEVDYERLMDALSAATGWELSPEILMTQGLRIQNLMRAFNTKHGQTRAGDHPSHRMLEPVEMPVPVEDYSDRYEEALDRYYDAMGWDRDTTKPLPETLKKYDLEFVIPDLW